MSEAPAAASFPALGTTATVVVVNQSALPLAEEQLRLWLGEVDRVCSRFQANSELARVNARAGSWVSVSPLLLRFLQFALDAAQMSEGRVDPTLGAQLQAVGYDRTFALVRERESWHIAPSPDRRATWESVELDDIHCVLRVPPGVQLDLGATAKALAADDAANGIARSCETGVLVSLGGDIAVAGDAPEGGWTVLIADDHAAPVESAGPKVTISTGGLATSSTAVRRWRTDSGEAHHILDPRTSRPAVGPWRTVSVAAVSCVVANVAATTAIILGEPALDWLAQRGLPARCVRQDGSVVAVAGWPAENQAA